MVEYLAWWLGGGCVGMLCGALLLRCRGVAVGRALVPFAVAIVGCLYGAKLQFRLRDLPFHEAIFFEPGAFLTPGFHIPLGLVLAFVLAIGVGGLLRISRLDLADALALSGAVMMPIGRVGCMLAGCCTGAQCPAWLDAVCVRAAPPEAGSVFALPAYFAALGCAILAVHLWMLRRHARPGSLAAVAFLLYPLGQLAIEQLRDASPNRAAVMTPVLVGMVLADALVCSTVLLWLHRARRAGRVHHARLANVAAMVLVAIVGGRAAAVRADEPAAWQVALQRYAENPATGRGALFRVGRRNPDGLPPVFRVALADAHMRSGHLRTAARLFERLLDEGVDEPWLGLAALGRGWIAARHGDLDTAREFFLDGASSPNETGLVSEFMVGMIDAGNADAAGSIARFSRLAAASNAPPALRSAAAMAGGYARLWSGDDAGALAVFSSAVNTLPADLADDARYGAALAGWRSGDVDRPKETFRTLEGQGDHARRRGQQSARLVALDPRAIVRSSAKRYRRLPLRMPVEHIVPMLDLDTHAIARIALRRLEAGKAPPPRSTRRTLQSDGARPQRAATASFMRDERVHATKGTAPKRAPDVTFPWGALVLAAALLSIVPLVLMVPRRKVQRS